MKKLKDNLFAVEVPLWSTQHELYDVSDYTIIKYPSPEGWGKIKILKEQYKIIGTITESNIDFDTRPYLSSYIIEDSPSYPVYRIVNHFGDWPYSDNPIEAFKSIFYWFYFPEDIYDPDDYPLGTPSVQGKLLILQMVNFTSEFS